MQNRWWGVNKHSSVDGKMTEMGGFTVVLSMNYSRHDDGAGVEGSLKDSPPRIEQTSSFRRSGEERLQRKKYV